MRFAVPKPIHGWRAFAGEVGIIVIGVLIALGAQQLVEAVRDRQLADQTRAAVTEEIEQNLLSLSLRGTAEPRPSFRSLRRGDQRWQRLPP